jgi:hypothetical protein
MPDCREQIAPQNGVKLIESGHKSLSSISPVV